MDPELFMRLIHRQLNTNINSAINSFIPEDLLDHLMNAEYTFIPEDFWEPVKVNLNENEINSLKVCNENNDCIICSENKDTFKEMSCCKNKMCKECTQKWFNESVYCPYCKRDIREINATK
jgi:hypothetical protein